MDYIFLIVLIVFLLTTILCSFGLNIKKIYNIVGHLFFWTSLYLQGKIVFSQETDPIFYLAAGLIIGPLAFFISLFLTTLSFKEITDHGIPFKGATSYFLARPINAVSILIVSVVEEFVWRAVIQDHFGNAYLHNPHLSVIVTAFLFTLVHKKNLENDFLKKLEFFLFSLLLGYGFLITHSFILVVLIHLMRNANIEYRNFLRNKGESAEMLPS